MKNRERQRANRKRHCSPKCDMSDCFANRNGSCCALQDNDFGGKSCPFYKTNEQSKNEGRVVLEHLSAIGRCDLIEKYYGQKESSGYEH